MPISTKEFEERGRASPFLNTAEDVVARDLRSRGWGAELAKDMGPAGEPDLKAQKAAQAIFVEVKSWSETAPSVTFTRAQFPRHHELAESGTPCYLAFVVGTRVYYYQSASPP